MGFDCARGMFHFVFVLTLQTKFYNGVQNERSARPNQSMVSDSEKLSTLLPYIRAMDDETKKKLERLRQSNGNGANVAGIGYGELLDKIYEVHAKFEKERQEHCRPLLDKLQSIQNELQERCMQEIQLLVEKVVAPLRKS